MNSSIINENDSFRLSMNEEVERYVASLLRKYMSDMEVATANLRIEVDDLRKEVEEKSRIVGLLENYVRRTLVKDVLRLSREADAHKREVAIKKFFCGDMGFLFLFVNTLSGVSEMQRTQSLDKDAVKRLYCKNFYPVINSLMILRGALEQVSLSRDDIENMTTEQLLDKLENCSSDNVDHLFYTQLWNSLEGVISVVCDEEFENRIPTMDIAWLVGYMKSIRTIMEENGIEIAESPTDGTEQLFMSAANADVPSMPLVRRVSDGYVYSYGIINTQKPFIL